MAALVRKKYKEPPSLIGLKVERELLERIDGEVLRQSVAAGRVVSRTDVLKALIVEALDARAKRTKK